MQDSAGIRSPTTPLTKRSSAARRAHVDKRNEGENPVPNAPSSLAQRTGGATCRRNVHDMTTTEAKVERYCRRRLEGGRLLVRRGPARV